MRAIEKGLIAFSVIGLAMDLLRITGGAFFLLLGLGSLCVFYFILTPFLFRDNETKKFYPAVSLLSGLALSITCAAILFDLLLWPGRDEMAMITLIFLVLLLIVILFFSRKKNVNEGKAKAYRKALQRLIPFFIVAGILAVVPDSALIRLRYGDDPEHARLIIRMYENPENEQYRRELEDYEINKYYNLDSVKYK